MNASTRNILIAGAIGAVVFTQRRRIGNYIQKAVNWTISQKNEAYLKELHPRAKMRMRAFLTRVEKELGWKPEITSGYRSMAKQQQLINAGENAAPVGLSWHNYGLALDLNFTKDGRRLREYTAKSEWDASGIPELASSMGLRWLNYDRVHFDMGSEYNVRATFEKMLEKSGGELAGIKGNQSPLVRTRMEV